MKNTYTVSTTTVLKTNTSFICHKTHQKVIHWRISLLCKIYNLGYNLINILLYTDIVPWSFSKKILSLPEFFYNIYNWGNNDKRQTMNNGVLCHGDFLELNNYMTKTRSVSINRHWKFDNIIWQAVNISAL